ncbi:MAG: hypothetical protein ABIH92_05120 [Nanoarchaeota archaeon]
MVVQEKNPQFGESSVTVIALTRHYGTPQYVLVDSDFGKLKFPGLRYQAAHSADETLEDVAQRRFEEQTGLRMTNNLGLRVIMPTRSRHDNSWIFRYIFLGICDDLSNREKSDRDREVFLADLGRGIDSNEVRVEQLGHAGQYKRIEWVAEDNREVAQTATDMLNSFDWEGGNTNYYRRIPCVGAKPLTEGMERPLGCGLAVASMILLHKPGIGERLRTILVEKRTDELYPVLPGFAGGKIQTPEGNKLNLDPISCCMAEGEEELGFEVVPRGIICCAHTPLDVPVGDGERYYVGIDNVAFVAAPRHPGLVKGILEHPEEHLEGKMKRYVVETLGEFRDRVDRGDLRTPDMAAIGREFYRTPPGQNIPLTQIIYSGAP